MKKKTIYANGNIIENLNNNNFNLLTAKDSFCNLIPIDHNQIRTGNPRKNELQKINALLFCNILFYCFINLCLYNPTCADTLCRTETVRIRIYRMIQFTEFW